MGMKGWPVNDRAFTTTLRRAVLRQEFGEGVGWGREARLRVAIVRAGSRTCPFHLRSAEVLALRLVYCAVPNGNVRCAGQMK